MPDKWGSDWDTIALAMGYPLYHSDPLFLTLTLHCPLSTSPGFLLVSYLLGEWDNLQPLVLQLVLRP